MVALNKRHLHHIWRYVRHIKPTYFIAAAAVCGVVSVAALRHNNQHMAVLRDAVYSADKNNGDVQTALKNLQSYVTAHMNTSLTTGATGVYPPIQLQYTYQRLQDVQTANNNDLYTQAQTYCQQVDSVDFSGHNRVPCIEQYVKDHGQKSTTIPTSLYQFDFLSPSWSPDLAGWSLVVTFLLAVTGAITFVVDRWFKRNV